MLKLPFAKIVLILFLISVSCVRLYAADVVTINLAKNVFPSESDVVCTLDFSKVSDPAQYKIKAISQDGLVQTYNAAAGVWVTSTASWVSFPSITPSLRIRFPTHENRSYALQIVVKQLITGKEYKSSVQKVWIGDYAQKLLERVNSSLVPPK
jgi:hypothetical protein